MQVINREHALLVALWPRGYDNQPTYRYKVQDEIGDKLYTVGNEYGMYGMVRADNWEDAYYASLYLVGDADEPEPEPDVEDYEHELACWQEHNTYRDDGTVAATGYYHTVNELEYFPEDSRHTVAWRCDETGGIILDHYGPMDGTGIMGNYCLGSFHERSYKKVYYYDNQQRIVINPKEKV